MFEARVQDLEVTLWSGLLVPAATPEGIVRKLEGEIMEIAKLPEVRDRLRALAVEPSGGPAKDLTKRIAREIPRWRAIANSANIKLD
jgi:tripartite-type tricarboxylate transporter receptor subunit TctC